MTTTDPVTKARRLTPTRFLVEARHERGFYARLYQSKEPGWIVVRPTDRLSHENAGNETGHEWAVRFEDVAGAIPWWVTVPGFGGTSVQPTEVQRPPLATNRVTRNG